MLEAAIMKVMTLNGTDFEQACRQLAGLAEQTGDVYQVVGIRTGGARVGAIVFDELKKSGSADQYFEVSASRQGSSIKSMTLVRALLNHLPRGISNSLRSLEHHLLSRLRSGKTPAGRNVELGTALVDYLQSQSASTNEFGADSRSGSGTESGASMNQPIHKILLVDDAIDSGSTILQVSAQIHALRAEVAVMTAVVVVTQKSPLVEPDFSLYRDLLIRFPWSHDNASNTVTDGNGKGGSKGNGNG